MSKLDQRIVVFLDVLGFKDMIYTFESEALENEDITQIQYHESPSLNKYISILNDAISLIRNSSSNYYLFSDNICITLNYIENENSFIDVIKLICTLIREFSREGYFLRGGIDVGWFFDSEDIAVGTPLINSYVLESKLAIYPRVLLSTNFIENLVDDSMLSKLSDLNLFLKDNYLKKDEDHFFINYFYYITSYDDKDSKKDFLIFYKELLSKKILEYSDKPRIKDKYVWLAKEFNNFIDVYSTSYDQIDLVEHDFYTDDEIKEFTNLKVDVE